MLAVLLALALAPATWLRAPMPPPDHRQVLRLVALDPVQERIGPFRLVGVWHLTSPNSAFGSYSAMIVPQPGRFIAFSDRADLLEFPIPGTGHGPIRIGSVPGTSVRYKQFRDIEAATRDPATGRIWFALEGRNAVARHGPDLTREALRPVPEMRGWGYNSGGEAMVRLSDGRFVVLCECTVGLFSSGEHPALLFSGDPSAAKPASHFTFAGFAGYRPTALAELPDGRVMVLVRRLIWPMPPRFRAKLLLADPAEITPDGTWRATELASIEAPLEVDNFEALTITPGANGLLNAWLMSDDNQALTQRTLLWKLEFSLEDLPKKQKAPGSPDAPR